MTITVTYLVDRGIYLAADMKHDILLITTEYKHGNDLLVHLQIGGHVNDKLVALLPKGIRNEQFLFKKAYNKGDFRAITRSTFNEKLSQFDKNQTVIEREVLEKYSYTDKRGKPDDVQIVMTDSGAETIATIDFKDIAQYENFSCPAWLLRAK